MRRAIATAAIASTAWIAALSAANADSLQVPMDEVKLVTFEKPIATVYVGNTVYADVTMIDSRHVFLLGKTYGQTNLIALSADGSVVSNDQVEVLGRRSGLVTLNRGSQQFTYACTANHCEAQPVPGDVQDFFQTTHGSQATHEGMAQGAAAGAVASNAPAQ
jgi:hypothetical protein